MDRPERTHRSCVFGFDIYGIYMHNFPHPTRRSEMFAVWMSIVGEKLKERDPMKIYTNKRICDRHFTLEHKTTGHRLSILATPTINLEGIPKSNITLIESEHNYCIPRITHVNVDSVPSTSEMTSIPMEVTVPSSQPSVTSAKRLRNIPNESRRRLKNQKNEIYRLRAKGKIFKERLKNAEKFSGQKAFQKLVECMSDPAKLFTRVQAQETKKKPKGRRYTIDEKILALSVYKRSPKTYKLLSRLFTLPSRKSLKIILSQIKLSAGINESIFEELKKTVAKLSTEDRLVTLIFDEMSLTPQIHYNAQSDELVGFENYGHKKTINIADHVLVLMVKGVKANFKQLVAYYFTQSLKSGDLKEIIKDVIKNVQGTGLEIIATVCDQGTNNVSAINSLVKDTKAEYLR